MRIGGRGRLGEDEGVETERFREGFAGRHYNSRDGSWDASKEQPFRLWHHQVAILGRGLLARGSVDEWTGEDSTLTDLSEQRY